MTMDAISTWPITDKLDSFRKDGVLGKLEQLAPHSGRWHTQLTKAAYRKGLEVGETIDMADDAAWPENPYDSRRLPNYMRGDNDPRRAWNTGAMDGQRIRAMLTNPAKCNPPLRQSEYRLLPPSLKALAE